MIMANKDYDRLVTERINQYNGHIIAKNGQDKLGVDYIDLNGFAFLQFTIFTATTVKTLKGCNVKLICASSQHEIQSDTDEIESDFSHELNTGILDFDIDLEDEFEGFLFENEVTQIQFNFEKTIFEFNEINLDLLSKVVAGEFNVYLEEEE